ncbi:NADH-quinone oxidoreductase subunit E-like [Syntrophomonas zehnderi OL-4]|uniref:NADH-quinone oxidoreductase subunit E-like n=1 Tax=Syntrophomonas zehnderi OL-4 TaxID=690567 RepID=A0A0E4GDE1_9FIRM|nr:NAD(P)H-dependent oxidoreductase subunit E [Syntrophomonas zehnderi]CFY06130.1 NADH-quinone oxidoreductase subunit E-like [Syntrophomonas zehnderi OL-4]
MANYQEIIDTYKDLPGGLIEAYHAIQREYSYIPEEAVFAAAQAFNIPKAEAYGVATFYSYLKVGKRGKNVIRICESAPCHIAGADKVVAALEKELGIKMGESTADGVFALEFAECVGQCQATPVITVNCKPYFDVTPEKIPTILAEYK